MSEQQGELESSEKPKKGFELIVEKAKLFMDTANRTLKEFYETYFGDIPEESGDETKAVDPTQHHEMHKDSRRRMGRSVDAITSKPVSSTRGNPTRIKKKTVVAKTYKPELDRF